MTETLRVAISADLFAAFARLPQAQQNKVAKFITNFQKNPRATSINYEKIEQARDPNLRSVRIDQAYRGIVLKPAVGDVYILLWVDHHDDAYAWARRHKCTINSETGAIQVFEVDAGENDINTQERPPEAGVEVGAFDGLKDRELVRLGVPVELLPLVRSLRDDRELDAVQRRLPLEAYEGLFLLLAGERYSDIINEREQPVEAAIDTGDFTRALQRPASQSRFLVADDELELSAMLAAPLDQWRVFLHPSQRRLVEGNKSGAVRVLGGAGTGKTVVAMHRAKWLAQHCAGPHQRVLFTTFTRNLATDIRLNLSTICAPDILKKIEVVNLDRWVSDYLRRRKYAFEIEFNGARSREWQAAMDLKPLDVEVPDSFYREEWERVVLPQGLQASDAYCRASRVGRGTRLSRGDRGKVWVVFEEYRNLMTRRGKKEVDDAYRDVAALIKREPNTLPYVAAVVDEAQDMGTQAFNLIRSLVPEGVNDLFIVGDGHQRIYGRNKVVLSQCGINIRGRSKKLRINYRTTEELRMWATRLLEGRNIDDLDGGVDDNREYKSLTHGEAPELRHFGTREAQAEHVVQMLRDAIANDEPLGRICVVARVKDELEFQEAAFAQAGIPSVRIEGHQSDQGRDDAVKTATMHRIKGLEFDRVILISINDGIVPLRHSEQSHDPVEIRQRETEERALVYVAVTRARKSAWVLSFGQASAFVCA